MSRGENVSFDKYLNYFIDKLKEEKCVHPLRMVYFKNGICHLSGKLNIGFWSFFKKHVAALSVQMKPLR